MTRGFVDIFVCFSNNIVGLADQGVAVLILRHFVFVDKLLLGL